MVLALLVTLVILGIGITVMWVSTSGMKVSSNIARRQEALYAAEAGIERGRALLFSSTDWTSVLKGVDSGGSQICTTGSPIPTPFNDYKGRVLCVGPDRLENIAFVSAPVATRDDKIGTRMSYTVWVRNDWTVECDTVKSKAKSVVCSTTGSKGNLNTINTDNNSRVILRAEGIGRDGLSYVALEAVVSRGVGVAGGQQYSQSGLNAQGTSGMTGSLQ